MGINISAEWERRRTHIQEFCPGASNTLFTTLDEDLVLRQRLPGLSLPVGCFARESNLDAIFILQPGDVFTILTDQRRVILTGDVQDFRGFVGLGTSRSSLHFQ